MSAVRAIIDALVAGGMDAAEAAVMVAQAAVEANARVPSKGAERTRRWREKRHKASQSVTEASPKTNVTKRHIPSQSVTSDAEENRSLSSSFLLTESEDKKNESKKERARAKLCPLDFQPTERHYEIGAERGQTREQVRAKATEMIEWSHANSGRAIAKKTDWNLAFNSWLRKENGNGQGRPRAFQNDELSLSRAADRLQDRIEREGIAAFPPRPTLLPREGPSDLQLLPPRRGTGP